MKNLIWMAAIAALMLVASPVFAQDEALEVIAVKGPTMEISWQPNTDKDLYGYEVYARVKGVEEWTLIGSPVEAVFLWDVPEDLYNKLLEVALVAKDEVGWSSEMSAERPATVDTIAPDTPAKPDIKGIIVTVIVTVEVP